MCERIGVGAPIEVVCRASMETGAALPTSNTAGRSLRAGRQGASTLLDVRGRPKHPSQQPCVRMLGQ